MRELLTIVLKRDGYDVLVAATARRRSSAQARARGRADHRHPHARDDRRRGAGEAKRTTRDHLHHHDRVRIDRDRRRALRLGAADYVHKSPNAVNDLRLRVRKELERKHLQQENVLLKRELSTPHPFANIVGSSTR